MSTFPPRDNGARKTQKSIPRFFVSLFIASFLHLPLSSPSRSSTTLPTATLGSTESKSLQRQNGDNHIARNYSSTQENSKSPGECRPFKPMSTLQYTISR
jgi:hypothetical protein